MPETQTAIGNLPGDAERAEGGNYSLPSRVNSWTVGSPYPPTIYTPIIYTFYTIRTIIHSQPSNYLHSNFPDYFRPRFILKTRPQEMCSSEFWPLRGHGRDCSEIKYILYHSETKSDDKSRDLMCGNTSPNVLLSNVWKAISRKFW